MEIHGNPLAVLLPLDQVEEVTVSIEDAAVLLGLTQSHVYKLMRTGQVNWVRHFWVRQIDLLSLVLYYESTSRGRPRNDGIYRAKEFDMGLLQKVKVTLGLGKDWTEAQVQDKLDEMKAKGYELYHDYEDTGGLKLVFRPKGKGK